MARYFVGFNWKSNPRSLSEAEVLFEAYGKAIEGLDSKTVEVVVFPPSILINSSRKDPKLNLGLQDISCFLEGPYTAEVSPTLAKSLGLNFGLVGHLETRKIRHLDDLEINQKLLSAVTNDLVPILCLGSQDEFKDGKPNLEILTKRLNIQLQGLKEILEQKDGRIILAYEPVWAIGTGKTADSQTIVETFDCLRSILENIFGSYLASQIQLGYGGSVDVNNITSLLEIPQIEGFLIGGASLKPEKFSQILEKIASST